MRQILITFVVLMLVSGTVLAHDGSEPVSNLEQWVAGIGMVLILITTIITVWEKYIEARNDSERDNPPTKSND